MSERVEMKQMNEHVWLMDDAHESTGYLVIGQEKAAVIDTMNGYEDLQAIVRTVTDLPLVVINTHGHPDHILGNVYFDTALMDPADNELAGEFISGPEVQKALADQHLTMPAFQPIRDGDVIDLGGLTLSVISLPGHTAGSVCLLLNEDRILFTGDAINHHLWMQLDHSLPLRTLLDNMNAVSDRIHQAEKILHGHARGFDDVSLFDQLRQGVLDLVEQKDHEVTAADADYHWFGGVAKQHLFAPDSVICYTPEKLLTR